MSIVYTAFFWIAIRLGWSTLHNLGSSEQLLLVQESLVCETQNQNWILHWNCTRHPFTPGKKKLRVILVQTLPITLVLRAKRTAKHDQIDTPIIMVMVISGPVAKLTQNSRPSNMQQFQLSLTYLTRITIFFFNYHINCRLRCWFRLAELQ